MQAGPYLAVRVAPLLRCFFLIDSTVRGYSPELDGRNLLLLVAELYLEVPAVPIINFKGGHGKPRRHAEVDNPGSITVISSTQC